MRLIVEDGYRLFDGQGVLYAENAALTALQTVKVSSAAEGFSKIAGECTDIGTLAACHPDHSPWQSEG